MKTVKIIAYGTLMTGEGNHRFCQNAVRIEPCTVTGTLYDMKCGYPVFTPTGNQIVHAELIEIPEKDWKAIDGLEGYPHYYNRMLITATLPNGSTEEGWIYFMKEIPARARIIARVIESGNWKKR